MGNTIKEVKSDNLSSNEIRSIVSSKSAIEGRFYRDKDKVRYLGLEDGTLKVIYPIKGEITGDLELSEVSKIGTFLRPSVISSLTQVETNRINIATLNRVKASKGFAIAMGVIF